MSHRAVKKILKKVEKTLDKSHMMWYNKGVKRRYEVVSLLRLASRHQCKVKKLLSFLKFPLDKLHKMWYNTSVPRGTKNLFYEVHDYGKQEDCGADV